MASDSVVVTPAARTAIARERQRELYGAPLRTIVYRVLEAYGVSQARLAATVGISPAMLCQLIYAKRVTLGGLAYTRLMLLDQRRDLAREHSDRGAADMLLAEVAQVTRIWPHHTHGRTGHTRHSSAEGLRHAASPDELAAAAVHLRDVCPAVADALRQAAENTQLPSSANSSAPRPQPPG
jgi:predicted transcriptional regulator